MDCSPPGSSVHGILQEGILQWVAIFFSVVCRNLFTHPSAKDTKKCFQKCFQMHGHEQTSVVQIATLEIVVWVLTLYVISSR